MEGGLQKSQDPLHQAARFSMRRADNSPPFGRARRRGGKPAGAGAARLVRTWTTSPRFSC
eukprot:1886345-Pyramimonas_sp.AAC.1